MHGILDYKNSRYYDLKHCFTDNKTKTNNMKHTLFMLTIFLSLLGCTPDDDDNFLVQGRVQRSINGEGVSGQRVLLTINQSRGDQYYSYSVQIDSTWVTTDADGNFSAKMKHASNISVNAYTPENSNYSSTQLSFSPDDPIILNVAKFIKFRIYVRNTSPVDDGDRISVDFFSDNVQSFRTGIENLADANYSWTETSGANSYTIEHASWFGTNVNSIVYFNVPETATTHKVIWYMRKNGIDTSGFTPEIPFQPEAVNDYTFEY